MLPDPMPRIAYPERLLDHALDLPNAIWRLHGVSTAWARCLLLAFRYTAVSDEKRQHFQAVWLHGLDGRAFDVQHVRDGLVWLDSTREPVRSSTTF